MATSSVSKSLYGPVLGHSRLAALARRQIPLRTGAIARKEGMTALWDEKDGKRIPVTILAFDRVQVTCTKTSERDGYTAVQIGAGHRNSRNVTRPMLGHFATSGSAPKAVLGEFSVRDASGLLAIGTEIRADHFTVGQHVDLRATSKGKGFAGVMKRWNFHGLRASHGVSLSHRSAGSTGQSQDPGRVLPGKKMAGRLGGERVTVQNARVIAVDSQAGTLLVKGPVPGPIGCFVRLQDAIKKPPPGAL